MHNVLSNRDPTPTAARTCSACGTSAVIVLVAGGFDGAFRVASMLHTRRYHVKRLSIEVLDDGFGLVSIVIDVSTTKQMQLLLARLSRLPLVVAAAQS
jgi:hypothetical protein